MNVKFRQRIERVIVNRVIKDALKAGYYISINNGGEEDEIAMSQDFDALSKASMLTDDEYVFLSAEPTAPHIGWIRFVYGNDGWDVISDYTVNLEDVLTGALKVAEKYEELF